MPRFGPILRVGWRRTHPQAMKDTLSSMDDKGAITLVRKAAAARYFSLNVSRQFSFHSPTVLPGFAR